MGIKEFLNDVSRHYGKLEIYACIERGIKSGKKSRHIFQDKAIGPCDELIVVHTAHIQD